MPIHSVRLPGLVAHQEVILGDVGADADDPPRLARPRVVHARRAARRAAASASSTESPVVGLEHLLFDDPADGLEGPAGPVPVIDLRGRAPRHPGPCWPIRAGAVRPAAGVAAGGSWGSFFVAWFCCLVLAGLGLLPAAGIPLGRSVTPAQPRHLARIPAPRQPNRAPTCGRPCRSRRPLPSSRRPDAPAPAPQARREPPPATGALRPRSRTRRRRSRSARAPRPGRRQLGDPGDPRRIGGDARPHADDGRHTGPQRRGSGRHVSPPCSHEHHADDDGGAGQLRVRSGPHTDEHHRRMARRADGAAPPLVVAASRRPRPRAAAAVEPAGALAAPRAVRVRGCGGPALPGDRHPHDRCEHRAAPRAGAPAPLARARPILRAEGNRLVAASRRRAAGSRSPSTTGPTRAGRRRSPRSCARDTRPGDVLRGRQPGGPPPGDRRAMLVARRRRARQPHLHPRRALERARAGSARSSST